MVQKLLGVKQVAEIINVRKATVYQWVNQRKIPHIKLGKRILFRSRDIDRWIDENKIETGS